MEGPDMDGPHLTVSVHRDDYPNPQVGDRVDDEENGPMVVVDVEPNGEHWWWIRYEPAPKA